MLPQCSTNENNEHNIVLSLTARDSQAWVDFKFEYEIETLCRRSSAQVLKDVRAFSEKTAN